MRRAALLFIGLAAAAAPLAAQSVGTMSELMIKIIYPASDAVFYITTRTPTTEANGASCRGRRSCSPNRRTS